MKPKISLTFDVEEWPIAEKRNAESEHNGCTDFSREGCIKLIHLLKKYDIKSTFFITGYFAENEPKIIKALSGAGQEVAAHGYRNVNLTTCSKSEIEVGITRSTTILSKLIFQDIVGFRAPQCYINEDMIDILERLGYQYDSSVHPAIVPRRYCNWRHPLDPYFLHKIEGYNGVLEIPISVIPWLRFPISWWWMRNMGNWITYLGTMINLYQCRNIVLYFHPWEFTDLPDMKGIPFHITRNCGDRYLRKLERFIDIFIKKYKFQALKDLSQGYRTDRYITQKDNQC